MKNLRERIEESKLPNCPIFELKRAKIMSCSRFETKDGVRSNYCKKCIDYDTSCGLYQSYLAKKFIEENGG